MKDTARTIAAATIWAMFFYSQRGKEAGDQQCS